MNHPSANNTGHDTPVFSSFVPSLGTDSTEVVPIRVKLHRMLDSFRGDSKANETVPLLNYRIISRSERDVYGQPRIITGWEALLHVLAWPTVIGVVFGFALAISLELAHAHASGTAQQTSSRAQVITLEVTS